MTPEIRRRRRRNKTELLKVLERSLGASLIDNETSTCVTEG